MPRTQQERRDTSIARLLDASIATIVEVGYAKASASTITRRAGLSHGALFRHFETMSDFMAATAREALRRQHADFNAEIERAKDQALDVVGMLRILRDVTGSERNSVMYELDIAARNDPDLRRVMQAGAAGYLASVHEIARSLPGLSTVPGELLATVIVMVTDLFDGEMILRPVRPLADDEIDRRIHLIAHLIDASANLAVRVPPKKESS